MDDKTKLLRIIECLEKTRVAIKYKDKGLGLEVKRIYKPSVKTGALSYKDYNEQVLEIGEEWYFTYGVRNIDICENIKTIENHNKSAIEEVINQSDEDNKDEKGKGIIYNSNYFLNNK